MRLIRNDYTWELQVCSPDCVLALMTEVGPSETYRLKMKKEKTPVFCEEKRISIILKNVYKMTEEVLARFFNH